jgi:hypothetical protein
MKMWLGHHAGLALVGMIVLGFGCSSGSKPSAPAAAPVAASPQRSGAQLWADNCTRCHYVRQPDFYSAAQWELVVAHMRQRANLTGVEARAIVQFLKAGSGIEGE